jgi:DNA replication and repair protein RecF
LRVETLSTKHFRNLRDPEVSLAPGVNLFVGENGQGKTNLLEAVYLFKYGRSFRTRRDAEMIRFGEAFCRAEATCSFADGHAETFAAAVERKGDKKVTISGEAVDKLTELVGRYPVVLFGPQDLRLISGQPVDRRRFVDMVGSMTSPSYIRLLKDYRRVLNHRNAALKARASRTERDAWSTELVDRGSSLIVQRFAVTAILEKHLRRHTKELDTPFDFSLEYESAILRESGELAGNGGNAGADELKGVFETKLLSLEGEEIRRGTTLAGPHRDDIAVKLSDKDARKYASQGQRRLLAILLKLAELSHIEAELKEPCVLLLDDVFSEFDREITGKLQGLLESGRQVLVTSPVPLDWAASRDVRGFAVHRGGVVEENV